MLGFLTSFHARETARSTNGFIVVHFSQLLCLKVKYYSTTVAIVIYKCCIVVLLNGGTVLVMSQLLYKDGGPKNNKIN